MNLVLDYGKKSQVVANHNDFPLHSAWHHMALNVVRGQAASFYYNGQRTAVIAEVDMPPLEGSQMKFGTNNSGGIQGGISNGQDIYFRIAFKPVATLLKEQETVDSQGNATTLTARGRHDACVLPRAVPVVEAMAAITILDAYLLSKSTQMGR